MERVDETDDALDSEVEGDDQDAVQELDSPSQHHIPASFKGNTILLLAAGLTATSANCFTANDFKRVKLPPLTPVGTPLPTMNGHVTPSTQRPPASPQAIGDENILPNHCIACDKIHIEGWCPLKLAGIERCPLCALPHYGHGRACPHLSSLTQLRAIHESLKFSTEPKEVKDAAKKKITGIIGDLNQRRRKAAESVERCEALGKITDGHLRVNGDAGFSSSQMNGVGGQKRRE